MERILFFRNMGKEEGEAAGRHCDNSSFKSMLVCLFLFLSLFLSFSRCLFVFFSIYKVVLHDLSVCVCICWFNVRLLYDYFCTG